MHYIIMTMGALHSSHYDPLLALYCRLSVCL